MNTSRLFPFLKAPNAGAPRALTRVAGVLSLLLLCLGTLGQGAPQTDSTRPAAIPASRQASNVAVITISGVIDQTTALSIQRRIAIAERAGADALVFEIDSPGGDLSAVLSICLQIKASPIKNTVAWVNRSAYSGGAIIALACREMITADPATLGDALIISAVPGFNFSQLPAHEQQKLLAPLMAELVDSARRNQYDELLVQGIAARGVELWLVEHKDSGRRLFINRAEYRHVFGEEPVPGIPALAAATIAESTPEPGPNAPEATPLPRSKRDRNSPYTPAPPPAPDDPKRFVPAAPPLAPLAGDVTAKQDLPVARPVITPADRGRWVLIEYVSTGDGPFVFKADHLLRYGLATEVISTDEELKAFFGARNVIRLDATWSEGMVAFLTMLPVQAVLLVVFLLGLFIEMTHPGLFLPGAVAFVALFGLAAPPLLIDLSSWWAIAAILGGIVLIALEVFVLPGFGVFGVLGLMFLFAGLVGTFIPTASLFPDTPAQRNDLLYGLATLLMAIGTSGVLMYFVARQFRTLPMLNRLVLQDPVLSDDQAGDELFAAMSHAPVRAGMTGVAVTPLRPAGRVQLGDRIVDVVSDIGYIPAGGQVRITSVSEFRIAVEPA